MLKLNMSPWGPWARINYHVKQNTHTLTHTHSHTHTHTHTQRETHTHTHTPTHTHTHTHTGPQWLHAECIQMSASAEKVTCSPRHAVCLSVSLILWLPLATH